MCGIAGFWRRKGPKGGDCERLAKMAQLLYHRGPDDFGYLYANTLTGQASVSQDTHPDFAPNLFLASRRLSITDLSVSGRQPMSNEAGDVFVVFNGAIHNFIELREELSALGHRFHTKTDTEVLLYAYETWGEACANHFNGMWSYVIWDQQRHRLVCSRDRFGIKPFYTTTIGESFYFASEAKAIVAIEETTRQPNLRCIRHIINTPTPQEGRETPFADIEQLPAAHNLIITEKKDVESQYWHYDDQSETYDVSDPEKTFRDLFYDAVKIRLRGDVPVSLLLSGGLDSTAVGIAASYYAPGELRAFTARFSGYHSDESEYATLAAAHAKIPLTLVDYGADNLLDDLKRVTWHMDSPVTKGQMLARWNLIEEASKEGTILFEGQGADEFLGGYPERYFTRYLRSEYQKLRVGNLFGTSFRVLTSATAPDNFHIIWETLKHRIRRPSQVPSIELLSERLRVLSDGASISSEGALFDDPLNNTLHRDHSQDVLPHLLHFGDAISMGHSMESRLPFLDHRLVEFVFALPFQQKISGAESKVILRRSLGQELPKAIMGRKKKVGFATPFEGWLQSHYESDVKPLLGSARLRDRDIFDPDGLTELMNVFETSGDHAWRVFRCASIELWFQQFIDGDGFSG